MLAVMLAVGWDNCPMAVMLVVGWDICHPNLPELAQTGQNMHKLTQTRCLTQAASEAI